MTAGQPGRGCRGLRAAAARAFKQEIRQAVRYERGLVVKARAMLVVVAVIVIRADAVLRLTGDHEGTGGPMAAWRIGLRPRVIVGSVVLLGLTAAALSVALVAGANSRAQGRELAQRLVPAAAASVDLLELYQNQQTWLRDYPISGHSRPLVTFDDQAARIGPSRTRSARLGRGDQLIATQLYATVAAYQAWLADIADPQLAAMSRG